MLKKEELAKLRQGIQKNQRAFQNMLPKEYDMFSCQMITTSFLLWAGKKTNVANLAYSAADETAIYNVLNYPKNKSWFSDHNPFHKMIEETSKLFDELSTKDPNMIKQHVVDLQEECVNNLIRSEKPSNQRLKTSKEHYDQHNAYKQMHIKPLESILMQENKKYTDEFRSKEDAQTYVHQSRKK